jgi:hypothetical protein
MRLRAVAASCAQTSVRHFRREKPFNVEAYKASTFKARRAPLEWRGEDNFVPQCNRTGVTGAGRCLKTGSVKIGCIDHPAF